MTGERVDQIFVTAKHWLLSYLAGAPDWVIQVSSCLLNIAAVLGAFLTLFALISVLERKILARIQNRYGPNRVGPFGLLQPAADGIKLLIKEDIVPLRADKVVHFIAPIMIAATAILALGVIPYGRNMTPFSIDAGILFFFAVGSTTELGVFMAGWGSNNKFSMLGAMRAIAQMVSYELPLLITVLPVVMIVGNNGMWGLEKHPMQAIYGWDVACDLQPGCRYDEVVRALGGDGETVTDPDEIGPALDRAFASGAPYLVNVVTDPTDVYPRSSNLA